MTFRWKPQVYQSFRMRAVLMISIKYWSCDRFTTWVWVRTLGTHQCLQDSTQLQLLQPWQTFTQFHPAKGSRTHNKKCQS